ncbi:Tetratricopeptide repeat superfamily protein [Perilla frutescens var. hirtella]|uniref:Tetratricopeptide repeat superfamily protein n=1 Tax=Perilla frutescens var. hirtella TaxID=608512 RepID=A0AAD4P6X3_PERFH|nr:Tetratricopeptide repeat superfamily protein [Perilla frutescens var. hirtella]
MVAGKVKSVMGLQKSAAPITKQKHDSSGKPPWQTTPSSGKQQQQQSQKGSGRSFGVYFPRASAQVQPRPPDVSELLRLVEELRESESHLKTELLEQKLLRESVAIVPVLESVISNKDSEIERSRRKIGCLEAENERLRSENEFLHMELSKQNLIYEEKIRYMQTELADIKIAVAEREREYEEEASSSSSSSSSSTAANNRKFNITTKSLRKCSPQIYSNACALLEATAHLKNETDARKEEISGVPESNSMGIPEEIPETSDGFMGIRSRAPRVPKPPPRPSASLLSTVCSSSAGSLSSVSLPSYGSLSNSAHRALAEISNASHPPPPVKVSAPPPPPPPPPPPRQRKAAAPPPPPPPPPKRGSKPTPAKVRRVPEVAEFYHSLMRRDSTCRKDSGGGGSGGDPQAAGATTAKDMIGEIENRSAHLLAIKSDIETQGDFIRFLIKEVEAAAFTDIEDVVSFVKWLDDELSYLVDERAVLKHFDWPEKRADALREAAFGYCDLKKLESEVSSFRDDPRQPCGHALKKIQSLFEKLEHAVYNLSRMRESATERYKGFHIPVNWMLDKGCVTQMKLASVKLAVKYMKRVSAELEMVGGGPEEEELIVQGVKFAFRVHQFAGGFDVETMKAFEELRDKARLCNGQCQTQQQHQQKPLSRSCAPAVYLS